jgi:hypothetical protein
MKTVIGSILVELSVDTIMIKDAKTLDLIRAKTVNANDAVDTYKELVVTLTEKHRNLVAKEQEND